MHQRVKHLALEAGAQRRQAAELYASNQLLDVRISLEVVALKVAVHEADRESIIVHDRSNECRTSENQLEILNTLTILLKCHRARVINKDDNVVKRKTHKINGNLKWNVPIAGDTLNLRSHAVGNRTKRLRGVESLKRVLLDGLLKQIENVVDIGTAWTSRRRLLAVAALTTVLLLLGRLAILLLLRRLLAILRLGRLAILLLLGRLAILLLLLGRSLAILLLLRRLTVLLLLRRLTILLLLRRSLSILCLGRLAILLLTWVTARLLALLARVATDRSSSLLTLRGLLGRVAWLLALGGLRRVRSVGALVSLSGC